MLFFDEPWNNTDKEQAIDRAYRKGTKHKVLVITLFCRTEDGERTIDEDVHDVVMGKKTMAQVLLSDKPSPMEREI